MNSFASTFSSVNESKILKCLYFSYQPNYLYRIVEKGFNKIELLRTLEKGLEYGLVQIDFHEYNRDKSIVCLTDKGKHFVEAMIKDNVV
ncbi:hypothetical protein BX659_102205 [Orenia metallireducens]|uniref:Winged helix DNA-binding domain-containing protein n=1 Tax=Orenia metallireducens TaxID=1413210 RepID=A0A285F407_9FIRM|nr:hypothetical protein [Orenia metallireducens]PRX34887.1 hypothetical protein BX659_102205 [Orenia metallireducens]SNY06049.1 hypothetical protein SAMN06265827_101205 [Orenia metallireducens]